jgi:flagellar motor switch protein FliN/FliY
MADNDLDGMDDWAAALAEQESAALNDPHKAHLFQPLNQDLPTGSSRALEMILDIPVTLTVELGRTKLPIKGLLELAPGSVVELDGVAGEPMDVYVNDCLIAKGEVVVVNERFGIRITDVVSPSERIRKLGR